MGRGALLVATVVGALMVSSCVGEKSRSGSKSDSDSESESGSPYAVTYSQDYFLDYNENIAQVAAAYSFNAYAPDKAVEAWDVSHKNMCAKPTSKFKLTKTYHSEKTVDSFGFIGVDPELKMVIAAFRGTSTIGHARGVTRSMRRYKTECKIILPGVLEPGTKKEKVWTFGHVHKGLCKYWKNLALMNFLADLIELVDKSPKDYKLLFTGHSLGGAAATLASTHYGLYLSSIKELHYASHLEKFPIVYTFGEPRVGDKQFREKFLEGKAQSFRVVFRNDVIPHLAPCCRKSTKKEGLESVCQVSDASTVCTSDRPPGRIGGGGATESDIATWIANNDEISITTGGGDERSSSDSWTMSGDGSFCSDDFSCAMDFYKDKCLLEEHCPYHVGTQVTYAGTKGMDITQPETVHTVCPLWRGEPSFECLLVNKKRRKRLWRLSKMDHSAYWDMLDGIC